MGDSVVRQRELSGTTSFPKLTCGNGEVLFDTMLTKQGIQSGDILTLVLEEISGEEQTRVNRKVISDQEQKLDSRDLHVYNSQQGLVLEGRKTFDLNRLPTGLKRIKFGSRFNQPIDEVKWPTGLQRITFGVAFHQSLSNVCWPTSLRHLEFHENLNLPKEDVMPTLNVPTSCQVVGLLTRAEIEERRTQFFLRCSGRPADF